jgi:hypothetical protein
MEGKFTMSSRNDPDPNAELFLPVLGDSTDSPDLIGVAMNHEKPRRSHRFI